VSLWPHRVVGCGYKQGNLGNSETVRLCIYYTHIVGVEMEEDNSPPCAFFFPAVVICWHSL
jgi:hypothetical protein